MQTKAILLLILVISFTFGCVGDEEEIEETHATDCRTKTIMNPLITQEIRAGESRFMYRRGCPRYLLNGVCFLYCSNMEGDGYISDEADCVTYHEVPNQRTNNSAYRLENNCNYTIEIRYCLMLDI